MYSKKKFGPRIEPQELQNQLDIIFRISHPEPIKAVCYLENTAQE